MPISYDDALLEPLTTDLDVFERVADLIGGALRRQLWVLLLDDDDRQLPVIIPIDVPARPRRRDAAGFAAFLRATVTTCHAASVVLVLERPGPPSISNDDRRWFSMLAAACRAAPVAWRGPVLCHSAGVRWVAGEDYEP